MIYCCQHDYYFTQTTYFPCGLCCITYSTLFNYCYSTINLHSRCQKTCAHHQSMELFQLHEQKTLNSFQLYHIHHYDNQASAHRLTYFSDTTTLTTILFITITTTIFSFATSYYMMCLCMVAVMVQVLVMVISIIASR